jgi:sugar lactone lactonase YvrE
VDRGFESRRGRQTWSRVDADRFAIEDSMTNLDPVLSGSVELVLDGRAELAEGPVWDQARRVLWWVDINAGRVHRFEPVTGSDRFIEIGAPVGCIALAEDGALVVASSEALLHLDPETGAMETTVRFDPEPVPSRCNDGKCDPGGRFWVGRLALDRTRGAGTLNRLDGPGFASVLNDLTIPNGLDWPGDSRRMYFVDSIERTIWAFDYDTATGALGRRRTFATLDGAGLPKSAVPDGLSVDADDCVWVAMWGGGCVLRFSPDGVPISRIEVPVARVSSCAFGGDDLTELFITTAREDAMPDELLAQPTAGGIYRARPGVRGRPPRALESKVRGLAG